MPDNAVWDQFKEAIRESVDFVALVQETVSLPKSPNGTGRAVLVLCPFHEDRKSKSLAVYGDHASCYGACGQTWDVFGWAMQAWGCDFREARDRLADRVGIPRPDWSPAAEAEAKARRAREEIVSIAVDYLHARLLCSDPALAYALGRWDQETIDAHRLGYNDGTLAQFLKAQDLDRTPGGKIALSIPRGYLVYPHVRGGAVEYVSGRSIEGKAHRNPPVDLAGEKQPFYNACWHPTVKELVIVEGQADAMTLAAWGIPGAALCHNKQVSPEHLARWRKVADRGQVYLCLDSDPAGHKGTADLALQLGPLTGIITLPEDVNDVNALYTCYTWLEEKDPEEVEGIFRGQLAEARAWVDLRIDAVAALDGLARDRETKNLFAMLAQLPAWTLARYKKLVRNTLGITAREFDAFLNMATTQGEDDEVKPVATYCIRDGQICRATWTGYEALCNFTAEATGEIVEDDGQETARKLVLEGTRKGGQPLPRVEVEASKFPKMTWVVPEWGISANIYAGVRSADHVRSAIQTLSRSVDRRWVYIHTGWRKFDGKRAYLSHGGAVGLEGVEVNLPLEELRRYSLPTKPHEAQDAVTASLRFWDVAPYDMTIPIWSAMYLAPLAEVLPPDFVLWLFGTTGSMKSTLASLALCHFGAFPYNRPPANWEDTENAIEKKAFLVKDAPLLIDDYAPQSTAAGARDLERKAARVLRNIGNRTGRARMRADLGFRTTYAPRGLVMGTGEQLPGGQSIVARLFAVEMTPGHVDKAALSAAQAEADRYRHAMAGYLLWLAGDWERLTENLKAAWMDRRDGLRDSSHLRVPSAVAALYVGAGMGLHYAAKVGAITEAEAEDRKGWAWDKLANIGAEQSKLVVEERPTERFVSVLNTLLTQKAIWLAPRDTETTAEEDDWQGPPGADLLGWEDDDFVYLLPDAAYNIVCNFERSEGGFFPLKKRALYKMLDEDGGLVRAPSGKSTRQLWQSGKNQRILQVPKAYFEENEE